jgi:hypothetical protein
MLPLLVAPERVDDGEAVEAGFETVEAGVGTVLSLSSTK